MEKKLMDQLGMKVTITHREGERGDVVVRYTIESRTAAWRWQEGVDTHMAGEYARP